MSGDRHGTPNDRNLPPIREVLPDMFDSPSRPNPYSFSDFQRALPDPRGNRSQWERHSGYAENDRVKRPSTTASYSSSYSSPTSNHQRYTTHSPSPPPRRSTTGYEEPGYSYGVLRSGTSGTLTDATPPSDRAPGILRQSSATPTRHETENPNRKYQCDYCGKRFTMPSHLEIHLRTHTAQKPFTCEWPGCERTFSVRSNMKRHMRSHEKHEQQHSGKAEYTDDFPSDGETKGSSSSQYFHTSSAAGSSRSTPANYYSSSRSK